MIFVKGVHTLVQLNKHCWVDYKDLDITFTFNKKNNNRMS